MDRGKHDATLAVDPKLVERLAGPATPFGASRSGGVAASVLPAPEGARAIPIVIEIVPWRMGGSLRASVVVKASFAMLAEGGDAASQVGAPREPEPFRAADVHHKNQPLAHVVAASDRVPWKVAVDVTVVGHAHAASGEPVVESKARFALLQGGAAIIDKTVRVVGDREGPGAAPAPFAKMPIVYQRAFGGAGAPTNPIGCSGEDDDQPNILDPVNAWRPAGFGPIPGAWPLRYKLLGDTPRRSLEPPIMDLPGGFAFTYFQSAPPDQQLAELAPGAVLVLMGFHPRHERIDFELPDARAVGAVYGLDAADPDAPSPLGFRADTLHVDADRWIATITWRALVEVRAPDLLGKLLVVGGVGIGGVELSIPARRPEPAGGAVALASLTRPVSRPQASPTGTLPLPITGAKARVTLPFGGKSTAILSPEVPAPAASPLPVLASSAPLPAAVNAAPFEPGPAPDAPRVSALFHDLSKRRGAAAGITPRAKDAIAEPARREEQVDLERYAEISGRLSGHEGDLDELLAARGIEEPAFHEAERHWHRAMALELRGGGRALRDRFDDAYVSAWEASQPDRFGPQRYARLLAAERAGLLHVELAEQGLDSALGTRLRRVWRRRVSAGGPLADEVNRALADPAGG